MPKRKKRRKFKRQIYQVYMHLDLTYVEMEKREGAVQKIQDYFDLFYGDGVLHRNILTHPIRGVPDMFHVGFRTETKQPDLSIAAVFDKDHPAYDAVYKHQEALWETAKKMHGAMVDFSEIPKMVQDGKVHQVLMARCVITNVLKRLPYQTFPTDMQEFCQIAPSLPVLEDEYPIQYWFHSVANDLVEADWVLSLKGDKGFHSAKPIIDAFKVMPEPELRERQEREADD